MAIKIESGLHSSEMTHAGYEIHHSRDNYDDYRPFPKDANVVHLHHHNFYEVFFFISGNVTYLVENRTYHLRGGDVLLISPLEMHQPVFAPANGFYERVVLWIEEEYIQNLSDTFSLSRCFEKVTSNGTNLFHLDSAEQADLLFLLDHLAEEMQNPNLYSPLMEKAYMTQILCQLDKITSTVKPEKEEKESRMSPQIVATIDYINNHLTDDLSLELLAHNCYLSKQHLMRLFKDAMGLTIHSYIMKKRLLTAKQHMQNGASAKEAALLCGFHDYTVFYRAYKKEYGCRPSSN